MTLSKNTVGVLVDMIENKLAMMQIADRDELREVMTLQRCLGELHALAAQAPEEKDAIPHRGRHRKLADLMEDMEVSTESRQTA